MCLTLGLAAAQTRQNTVRLDQSHSGLRQPNAIAIPKGKLATVVSGDLSENSSAFGDNIISETLVEILIKQGKKDKAIEVLRKLIWKFPQKKAIFATQIDELKG